MIRKWETFLLKPATAEPLAALRIALAAILLVQAFMLRTSPLELFAHDGIVQGELTKYLAVPFTPRISWLADALDRYGVAESTCIYVVCWAYVISLVLLLSGLFTRTASIAAWFLHWTLMNTGYSTTYGVDLYTHVFLFYFMWMPVGDAWSLDVALGRRKSVPTSAARLGLRVLQLQLCITYLTSGIEKASGIQWWNGELLWRAFCLPVYFKYDMSWLANWPLLSKLAGWGTLLLELGYFIFIWPKRTRPFWIAGIVALHLGIAVFLNLGLFGVVMAVLTPSVFGFSPEPDEELSLGRLSHRLFKDKDPVPV